MPMLFGPEYPVDDKSNAWRNAIASGAIFFAIAGAVSWKAFAMSPPTSIARSIFSFSLTSVKDALPSSIANTGGDVSVLPPVPPPLLPILQGELLAKEEITAAGMIVKDVESGMVLYAKNEYERRPIASITKLMSALVLLEHPIPWTATTTVSPDAIVDTHMYAGDTYTLEELWQAMLIGSSNKAVASLIDALQIPRQAFIERMNAKALELGMSATSFQDPTGLDSNNLSAPADIVFLIDEALKHDKIRSQLQTKEMTLYSKERKKEEHIWNTNWLLLNWIPQQGLRLEGGKTGYTPEAGYNFTVQISNEQNHPITIVVLGAINHEVRFTEARDIANSVFSHYTWPGDTVVSDTTIVQ